MAFDSIKRTSGRIACTIFEIDLDINDQTYDAEFALIASSYGTPKTTPDVRAYSPTSIRTYRYSDQYIANLDCFPNLRDAKSQPPRANPGIDIGFRATASISVDDFESTDSYELQSPYDDRRVTGSHFAKLFARNFVKNRPARIRRGYLVDSVYIEDNFQTEHYIVDEYQGPTLAGKTEFNLVDVLALTNGINAKAPETTNASLNSEIADSSLSITVNLSDDYYSNLVSTLLSMTGGTFALGPDIFIVDGVSAAHLAQLELSNGTGDAGELIYVSVPSQGIGEILTVHSVSPYSGGTFSIRFTTIPSGAIVATGVFIQLGLPNVPAFGTAGETGYIAIDSEYIGYTVTSGSLSNPVTMSVTRGEFGTAASAHSTNATVQWCISYIDTNIIDIINDLLRNHTDIDNTYIPSVDWDSLKTGELSTFELTNIIAKETEVKKMLNELIQIAGLTMYVDVVQREIIIEATPNFDTPVITFTPSEHIEVGTLKVQNDFTKLVTRQLVRWSPKDYSSTDDSNWEKSFRVAAILEELPDRLGTKSDGKEVLSRWIPNTVNGNQIATGIAQRNVARFSQVPQKVSFEVDSKYVGNLEGGGRFWLGSVFNIETLAKVFCNGSFQAQTLTCQCTSVSAARAADKWQVDGIAYQANIPPNADYYIEPGEYIDYVMSDEFDFTDPDRQYIVVIKSGAVFGSTSTATPSFYQGTFGSGSTLKLIIQGQVLGKGGTGGRGGETDGLDVIIPPFPGGSGGHAMEITTDVIIDNSFGLIAGGGQGGQGGEANFISFAGYGGGGGGGGQGFIGGTGGLGGSGNSGDGGDGGAGTANFGGAGGLATGVGTNGSPGGPLGSGAAIKTNGNTVTIIAGNNSEQIKGAIV